MNDFRGMVAEGFHGVTLLQHASDVSDVVLV